MKKTILILVFLLGWLPPAKAFLLGGFVKLVSFPIKVPLKIIGFTAKKTTQIATKGTKAVLKNVTVASGPVKIRPFDFKS